MIALALVDVAGWPFANSLPGGPLPHWFQAVGWAMWGAVLMMLAIYGVFALALRGDSDDQ